MIKHITAFLLFFLLSAGVYAQTYTPLPYFEGFEGPQTETGWQLNAGADGFTNRWYVSSAESYMGAHSLLISDNNGASATYANVSNTVVAYREFQLPLGKYDLSFAWRCQGEPDVDGLYVCWVPVSVGITSSTMGLPRDVTKFGLNFNNKQLLNGASLWQVATASIKVEQTTEPYKLVFVWDGNADKSFAPSICVDNVQISSSDRCAAPAKVSCSFNASLATLSWNGSASEYEVMYRRYDSNTVDTISGIHGNSVEIEELSEGYHDFFVRGICAPGDTSIWSTLNFKLLYDPAAHCIDFINFTAPGTECTVGTFDDPYAEKRVVDRGYDSNESSHTTHFMPGEIDPRTVGTPGSPGLHTVPDGEVISVRLGNWQTGAIAESITYTYDLAYDDAIILMLKYAVVLQDPKHRSDRQPRFTMEILDETGELIDANCGAADFIAGKDGSEGWHIIPVVGDTVMWRDWTTVGINLTPYAGQTVKIRFTSYDCKEGGHFGYAYYTLSCAEAAISGVTCGQAITEVSAPDGFDYEWYKPEDPDNILWRERTFEIDESEADTFYCDVIFKEKSNCRFTLTANMLPRHPKADFAADWCPDTCHNYMRFRSTGGVTILGKLTGEKLASYQWNFGDGRTSQANDTVLEFPKEGGVYDVSLNVKMTDTLCVHDTVIQVVVPPVVSYDTTIYRTVCRGGRPIRFDGNNYTYKDAGEHIFRRKTAITKCDSIVTLVVEAVDEVADTIADTICAGEVYVFNGIECSEARTYTKRYTGGSAGGCDSVAVLNLTVLDTLAVTLSAAPEVCADDGAFDIPYVVESGETGSYALIFDDKACASGFVDADTLPLADGVVRVALPDSVRPGYYSVGIRFNVEECSHCVDTLFVPFCVQFPSTILAQKWNDAIAIYSAAHPLGGYEFSAYSWYKNGEQIPGEHGPYLYIGGNGQMLDTGAVYQAGLILRGDVDWIMTCPFEPEVRTDISQYITVGSVAAGQRVEVCGIPQTGIARWYTIAGQSLYTEAVDSHSAFITAPSIPGVYLVHLTLGNETTVRKIVVK